MSSPGPSYVPYNPKGGNKRQSVASIASLSSTPPSRPAGFVRPGTSNSRAESPLKAPEATNGAGSRPGSSGSGGGRPTPPLAGSSSGGGQAFPFQSVPAGSSPFPPSTPNRTASPSHGQPQSQGSRVDRIKAPYHSSFQPQGVRRDKTEEFMGFRKKRSEGKKLEEGRLGRRLEKLVALHFPPPSDAVSPPTTTPTARTATLASLAEFGGSLRGKSAKDLWRSVAGARSEAEKAAEQAIVKWQDDSEATRCPICMASFGIKTRRHHCRLCGRVVCFLPPTPPQPPPPLNAPTPPPPTPTRKERCSTFITYEYEGMVIGGEKKPVGVIVEIEQIEPDLSLGAVVHDVPAKEKDERKKVRLCKDCLNVVMRRQAQTLPVRTPTWLKLYEVLLQLEKGIEDALPEFQELVLGVQNPSAAHNTPSAHAASVLRKRLLTNLASYETIFKRVRDLPLVDGGLPGGTQDRLQRAVASKAGLFLQEKLGVLRSLGNADDSSSKKKKKKVDALADGEPTIKTLASLLGATEGTATPEATGKLAVLLEQEALVNGYFEEANARRQFEDATSLKMSLDELREEIRRIKGDV